jgi:hypothetical protein
VFDATTITTEWVVEECKEKETNYPTTTTTTTRERGARR